MSFFSNQVHDCTYVAITIPANGGTGTSIADLLRAGGYAGECKGLVIDGTLAGTSGTQRPAFLAATPRTPATAIAAADFSTNGRLIQAGALFYDPVETSAANLYVQSTNGSTIVALALVLL